MRCAKIALPLVTHYATQAKMKECELLVWTFDVLFKDGTLNNDNVEWGSERNRLKIRRWQSVCSTLWARNTGEGAHEQLLAVTAARWLVGAGAQETSRASYVFFSSAPGHRGGRFLGKGGLEGKGPLRDEARGNTGTDLLRNSEEAESVARTGERRAPTRAVSH